MPDFDSFGLFDFVEGDGDAYKYTSSEFTAFLAGLCGTGVAVNTGDELAATNSGLNVTVRTGVVYIKGRWGEIGSNKAVVLTPTAAGQSRYDRIVARMHLANRKVSLEVKSGTETTGTPTKPALTQNADVYEIPLWAALVSNGSTVTLSDERVKTYNAAEIIAQINSILTALPGKSDTGHTHGLGTSSITGLLGIGKGGTGKDNNVEALAALGGMPCNVGSLSDCNAQRTSGLYNRADWTNRPTEMADNNGTLFVLQFNTNSCRQIMYSPYSRATWDRYYLGGAWSDWARTSGSYDTLPVPRGGTGSETGEGALANLGLAISNTTSPALPPTLGATQIFRLSKIGKQVTFNMQYSTDISSGVSDEAAVIPAAYRPVDGLVALATYTPSASAVFQAYAKNDGTIRIRANATVSSAVLSGSWTTA